MDAIQELIKLQTNTIYKQVEKEIAYRLVIMTEKAYQQEEFELHHILCSVDLYDTKGLMSELNKYGYKLELVMPKYEIDTSNDGEYYTSFKLDEFKLKVTKTLFEI